MNPNNPTQSAQPAHTPLPWHVGMKPGPMIYGPQGEQIADLTGALSFNAGPNAAFIVRACNSHAQLVAALEATLGQLYLYKALLNENEIDARSPQLKEAIAEAIVCSQTSIGVVNAALSAALQAAK